MLWDPESALSGVGWSSRQFMNNLNGAATWISDKDRSYEFDPRPTSVFASAPAAP
ncbi:hypothetical protein PAXRUDRAFT_822423 [Paxillus rubicundulus Ve08.2h10]|uniref:Uncharacterized protein n=1 Tax=Paxillus rubicundulus Ve08.2h10 TaxID=930991 RepID=A0A0D0E9U8_9AGAM|nr:hypothetical protein PAXRUDRAFT_822423 [Paxillus rubicundulus Ve08.2h10]